MKLSSGKNPPEEVNVFIEIPQGSSVKYELDKTTGILTVDRFLYTAFTYPCNYGFIPNSHAEDGDPTDVLVLSSAVVQAGVVLPARPIGMLEMEDEAGKDTKIVAVPTVKIDPFFAHIQDIKDLEEATRAKIKHFFEYYKTLEPGKWVKVQNWQGKEAAHRVIAKDLTS